MQWIEGIKIPFIKKPQQSCALKIQAVPRISPSKILLYQKEIAMLLEKGAISKCSHDKNEFLSSYFLLRKPDGNYRFILNLKKLTNFIPTSHFKLEDYRAAIRLISQNSFLAKLDLQDAYFLLPIDHKYKKYLRFKFQNTLYEFNCLPFGLNVAPFIFTKLLKPIVKYLRNLRVKLVIYLDDILLIGRNYQECLYSCQITEQLLKSLGFLINYEKSVCVPTQKIEFLGFMLNSTSLDIRLPHRKIKPLKNLLKRFQNTKICRIRKFASLVGKLVSIAPAFKFGWFHTKPFEIVKQKCLKLNEMNFNKQMQIPISLQKEFKWWLQNLSCSGKKFEKSHFALEIYSDSSKTGWGAHTESLETRGFWSFEDRARHINSLELMAAFNALKSLAKHKHDCNILLRIDNITAVACINKMGSINYKSLNKIASAIWSWCESRNIYVFASYINTSENITADFLSRSKFLNTEFELNQKYFRRISHLFGKPNIDLFASHTNKKCKVYMSWFPDPDCVSVDAFTVNWNKYYFYAFPPFSLIGRVLQKIKQDRATGILIVPNWPSQPWYPIFLELLTQDPIILGPDKNLLYSPSRELHPLSNTLSLAAGRLSGRQ